MGQGVCLAAPELVISGERPGTDEIEILANIEVAKRVLAKIAKEPPQEEPEPEEPEE